MFWKTVNSKITDSLLNRAAVSILITHQSFSKHLEKDLKKLPPPPRKLRPFGSPFLLDISVPSVGGTDILWNYTILVIIKHYSKKVHAALTVFL